MDSPYYGLSSVWWHVPSKPIRSCRQPKHLITLSPFDTQSALWNLCVLSAVSEQNKMEKKSCLLVFWGSNWKFSIKIGHQFNTMSHIHPCLLWTVLGFISLPTKRDSRLLWCWHQSSALCRKTELSPSSMQQACKEGLRPNVNSLAWEDPPIFSKTSTLPWNQTILINPPSTQNFGFSAFSFTCFPYLKFAKISQEHCFLFPASVVKSPCVITVSPCIYTWKVHLVYNMHDFHWFYIPKTKAFLSTLWETNLWGTCNSQQGSPKSLGPRDTDQ